jgi:hypothetical protein
LRHKVKLVKVIAVLLMPAATTFAESTERIFTYKKQKDEIILRSCLASQLRNKKDCPGGAPENRISEDYFKMAMEAPFIIIDADKIKPLTANEKKIYQSAGLNPLEILQKRKSNLERKLALIEKLLLQNEKPSGTSLILKKAKAQLFASDPSGKDVLKLNKIILKFFNDKINSNKSIVETEMNITYSQLRQFDPSLPECGGGKNNTIEARILDCAKVTKSSGQVNGRANWNLVARKRSNDTGKFYEVWKDSKTGFIWGDRLDQILPHYYLVDLDGDGKTIKEKICSSDKYNQAKAEISERSFRLPTISELEQGLQDGMNDVFPNMREDWYWSATLFPGEYQDMAWGVANGLTQYRDFDFRYYYSSVKCVAR